VKKILILLFCSTSAMASFSGYTYRRTLTIDHAKVSTGTLTYTNFPVLFQDTDVTLSTGVGGHFSNTNAYDMIFSTNSTCNFSLKFDTETFNNTGSAQTNIYIQVPIISSTTDTLLYACYGNAAITTYQGISTATWDSNYLGVYHLGTFSAAQNLPAIDSTSNNNLGTVYGSTVTSSGQIDGAGSFVATSSNSISLGTPSMYSQLQVPMTISAWYYPFSSDGNGNEIVSNQDEPVTKAILLGATFIEAWTSEATCTSNHGFIWTGAGTPLSQAWHYIVETVSGTISSPQLTLALDGYAPQSFSPAAFCASPSNSFPTVIGGNKQASAGVSNSSFNGFIDEVRISNIARSADWNQTEYNNQHSPSTFMSIGAEVGGPVIYYPTTIQGTTRIRGNVKIL